MAGRRPDPVAATAKGSDRHQELLDATEHILVGKGNAQLSMRAVAAQAEVRLGHLQYYFPTRADLIQAVLTRALRRSLRRLADLTDTPEGSPLTGDPAQLVHAVLAEQHDPALNRLFVEIWALAARDESAAGAVRAFYQDYTTHVTDFVQRHNPALPADTCAARAQTFVMLVEGASLFRSGITADRSAGTDAELVRTAARLLQDSPPTH